MAASGVAAAPRCACVSLAWQQCQRHVSGNTERAENAISRYSRLAEKPPPAVEKKKKTAVKHPVEELHLDVAKASLEEPQTEARSTITFIHFVLQYNQLETCNPT